MYVGAQTPILLQTARMQLFNPVSAKLCLVARAVLDSGSQRTYVTRRLRDRLKLPTIGTESLRIKTFGATETQNTSCDLVVKISYCSLANETHDFVVPSEQAQVR